jgi:hypothetical protein
LKDLSINGGVQDGKARLVIEAQLQGLTGDKDKALFSTTLQHVWQSGARNTRTPLPRRSTFFRESRRSFPDHHRAGEIKKVTGENLQDWSVRQETSGARTLVLRPRKTDKPLTQLVVSHRRRT